jgi:hypothetical protein
MTHTSLPAIIPWEERPAGNADVVWLYSGNLISPYSLIPSSNSIFNSAVVLSKKSLQAFFVVMTKKREVNIHRVPNEAVGRIAMEQLFSFFDKQFPEDITLLPTELITRHSCGCNT